MIKYIENFYPKGLIVDDPQYFESAEIKRLLVARENARENRERWNSLKVVIEKEFPEYHLEDWSHLLHDAAYIGRLYFKGFESGGEHTKALVFSVSIIAPYFMLYYSDQIKEGGFYLLPTLEFTSNIEYGDQWNTIIKCIKSKFSDFQEMSPEIVLQKVDNYCVGNNEIGEATIAEYIFSDHIW